MSKSSEGLSRRLQAGEPGNLLDVNSLRLRREVTDPHILDHAAAKWGHWQLLYETNGATWRHQHRLAVELSGQRKDQAVVANGPSEIGERWFRPSFPLSKNINHYKVTIISSSDLRLLATN